MEKQRVFVIRPFGKKTDSAGSEIDFERVHRELIAEAIAEAGLVGGTTGEILESGNIREDMFALIVEADLIICDITIHNANVFYELGIRHALRKRRTVMIKGQPVADSPPFDLLTDRYHSYPLKDPASAKDDLVKVLKAALSSIRETDSPIFKMLPTLCETDPASVGQVVPNDLVEEVGRAKAAKAKGWLRLLAKEVAGRRFQWPALRLIGAAQWDLEDWDGARETFETLRAQDDYDVRANLALANIYERVYRRTPKPEILELSEQAIVRVLLRHDQITAAQRAEAVGLKGRNQKTLWRLGFERIDDPGARRTSATNQMLLRAYEGYRDAYLADLNDFWPGLAALQLGMTALDLARDKENWEDSFDGSREAEAYAGNLTRAVTQLRATVSLAVSTVLDRLPPDHEDRVWAEASLADLKFLIDDRESRVIKAYLSVAQKINPFAWNAAKSQLQLFARLGFRAQLAEQIIGAVESVRRDPTPCEKHVVIFVAHRIDGSGRTEPCLPAEREERTRAIIREKLKARRGENVSVLAAAAPGGDILCHEVCRELGIKSTICLPTPRALYLQRIFGTMDAWRSRFLDLVGDLPVLQLSDCAGLPRWLSDDPVGDPSERANRWVLEMALASNAATVSLLALCDGKDAPSGAGQMVTIARQAPVDIDIIDTCSLAPC
jgi:hypothetical protein